MWTSRSGRCTKMRGASLSFATETTRENTTPSGVRERASKSSIVELPLLKEDPPIPYQDMYQRVHRQSEHPLVVQNYLTATWARRLGRPMPEPPGYLPFMVTLADDAPLRARLGTNARERACEAGGIPFQLSAWDPDPSRSAARVSLLADYAPLAIQASKRRSMSS